MYHNSYLFVAAPNQTMLEKDWGIKSAVKCIQSNVIEHLRKVKKNKKKMCFLN